jgi:predicted nucleic acid-binding protein
LEKVKSIAQLNPDRVNQFKLPRDSKDEPYTDLAIGSRAAFLATWNERHLTYLMKQDTPEGRDFCNRFPWINILSPPDFLNWLRSQQPKS